MKNAVLIVVAALMLALGVVSSASADGRAGPGEFVEAPPCSIDNIDEDCVYV